MFEDLKVRGGERLICMFTYFPLNHLPKSLKITSLSQEPETKEDITTESPPCYWLRRPIPGASLPIVLTDWDIASVAKSPEQCLAGK